MILQLISQKKSAGNVVSGCSRAIPEQVRQVLVTRGKMPRAAKCDQVFGRMILSTGKAWYRVGADSRDPRGMICHALYQPDDENTGNEPPFAVSERAFVRTFSREHVDLPTMMPADIAPEDLRAESTAAAAKISAGAPDAVEQFMRMLFMLDQSNQARGFYGICVYVNNKSTATERMAFMEAIRMMLPPKIADLVGYRTFWNQPEGNTNFPIFFTDRTIVPTATLRTAKYAFVDLTNNTFAIPGNAEGAPAVNQYVSDASQAIGAGDMGKAFDCMDAWYAAIRAEKEARIRDEEEARRRAEEEAWRKAEEEARRIAEEEARRRAEAEAREAERRRIAEEEARRKTEEDARREAEQQRIVEAARQRAEQEKAQKRDKVWGQKDAPSDQRNSDKKPGFMDGLWAKGRSFMGIVRQKTGKDGKRPGSAEITRNAATESKYTVEEARRKAEEERRKAEIEEARRKAAEEAEKARKRAEEAAREVQRRRNEEVARKKAEAEAARRRAAEVAENAKQRRIEEEARKLREAQAQRESEVDRQQADFNEIRRARMEVARKAQDDLNQQNAGPADGTAQPTRIDRVPRSQNGDERLRAEESQSKAEREAHIRAQNEAVRARQAREDLRKAEEAERRRAQADAARARKEAEDLRLAEEARARQVEIERNTAAIEACRRAEQEALERRDAGQRRAMESGRAREDLRQADVAAERRAQSEAARARKEAEFLRLVQEAERRKAEIAQRAANMEARRKTEQEELERRNAALKEALEARRRNLAMSTQNSPEEQRRNR